MKLQNPFVRWLEFKFVFDKINKYLKKFATFTKKGERVEENSRTCYTTNS